jgi:hypothetical protein
MVRAWNDLHSVGNAIIACCLLLGALPDSYAVPPVAIVVDATGVVQIGSGAEAHAVRTLELLSAGANLHINASARVVVLYLASGAEYSSVGLGLLEVGDSQLTALSGAPPSRWVPPPGTEVRLRVDRVVQGGVAMRKIGLPEATSGSERIQPDLESRRPAANAPFAKRVAYSLWLEDVGAWEEARAAWRGLALERPTDEGIARRAR